MVSGLQILTNLNFALSVQTNMQPERGYQPAERVQRSFLSSIEKRALIWIAHRLPAWLNSDHLTLLGFLSLVGVGFSYWYSRESHMGLALANLFLILNWFGDSLDGTVARVRNQQRPRYGFYVDHILDACGSVFVFAGLALSGYMNARIAVALLVAYLLLSIEAYLATYTVGVFQLSFGAFGPTELRLLLMAGNLALLVTPSKLLFNVGGAIGAAGMMIALVWSIARHAIHLYRAETCRSRSPRKLRPILRRWWRFNLVGIAGFALQLGLLWFLARICGIHYLIATALAVELAVLHNFAWHEAWTWPNLKLEDRWRRLLRFNLADGFVSIASNVLFTMLLMQWIGLPLLVANTVAVLIMALLNFALAESWVFRERLALPGE
jgi:archaetidylinositol phosphate synthase